ncbi:MAG: FAD-dependent oxidoreductase [Deltaproteobacteria bacterium]|nr:FAD-dependent oxidoreductase [Deltaproteobacteria bacterium]
MVKYGTGDASNAVPPAVSRAALLDDSPCHRACPVGINVKAYVGLLAAGRPLEAAAVIRERNPLPHACSRLCSAPCERECLRAEGPGGAVSIRALKRFAADVELERAPASPRAVARWRGRERVVVVGAGPAGLTAAHDLARAGFRVTLLEAGPEPGGLLASGVPAFRMPRAGLAADIDAILALGVELRTGTRVDLAAPEELLRDGCTAAILAVGSAPGPRPEIPGLPAGDCLDAAKVLEQAARGNPRRFQGATAVVAMPGGAVAGLAAARVAARSGATAVTLVVPTPPELLPLDEEDRAAAERDGVRLLCGATVLHAARAGEGWVLELSDRSRAADLGPGPDPVAHARARVHPAGPALEGAGLRVDAVVAAGPRTVDLGSTALRRGVTGAVTVDPVTLQTSLPRIFAAGECSAGPRGVIEAMAAGRRAARSVVRLARGGEPRAPSGPVLRAVRESGVAMAARGADRWDPAATTGIAARLDDPDPGMTEPQAAAEARRCRMCGPCEECRRCTPTCEFVHAAPPGGRATDAVRVERSAADGTTITAAVVDARACIACGVCAEVCPWSIPRLRLGKRPAAVIHAGTCRACGLCAGACPAEAIAQPGWRLGPDEPPALEDWT